MAISKRTRYEVLRRDDHRCRYCGAAAPDVKLTVDHVVPVALGGADDPTNLAAACRDCNAGKSSSNPDAPLVADVQRSALVWSAAIDLAVKRRQERAQINEALTDYFDEEWESRHYGTHRIPDLPTGWQSSVIEFYARGLSVADFDRAIDIAITKPGIALSQRWSYFCGVCWNMVREIEDDARAVIAAGAVEV